MNVCHSFGFSFIRYNGNRPAGMLCMLGGGETFRGRPAMDGTASPIAQLVRAPH